MSGFLSDFATTASDRIAPSGGSAIGTQSRQVVVAGRWPGLDLRLCREDIDQGSDWHIHPTGHVVVVHLAGRMQSLHTRIEDVGVRDRVARPGEIWLVPPGHSYQGQARGRRIAYAELELAPDAVIDLPGDERRGRLDALAPCLGRRDDFLALMVRQLGRLLCAGDDLSMLLADSLQSTLRLHLLHRYAGDARERLPVRSPAAAFDQALRRRLVDYIEARLDERIVLAELAAIAGVTVHCLLTAFRDSFGTSPAQYILDQRIERACRLLASPHHGIADIALATGFSSHSHFTAAFRQRTGLTPQQFRSRR